MHHNEAIDILLIEDNDFDAELSLRALHQNHLSNHIIRLADGQEALDYLFPPEQNHVRVNPKLILLDLKLPGLSGLEVLQALKGNVHTSHIPVVVLTSSTEEEDIAKCYELGVNSFISKPVEFDSFMDTVRNLGFYWLLLNKAP
jgi:two-component system response regulator